MENPLLTPNQLEVLSKIVLMVAGLIYLYFTNKSQEDASKE